ncbi:ribonuclease H2 subunit C, putative [Plasmodium knowlesi strain H]|uniref:Ribonuclease H2 subunit C, putative n=3 Tax=Plasmodium knowlesi TaxID=5850 RepID=A0A5K1VFX0_PLAKH|nr:ribonuclease H2 subunit C, putative [Plasmodium knowlesi strain H]OTN67564.1 putative Ribonuclease H2 subunit C [Plasmodium knowlesi]CAA9987423.1 ribonuclease H2 subunit C, putative [Plasmodium knowlesi strain H]SBO23273.1 ribonuclease H2 subunit C, putative [Plasmodium knowlesi strain H]SBO24249.1 ribonuclease H2 subunit C, putative [Plasmodium knowlesi strain H]VVS76897.1 ribonuclease H2 subunit C, putative [Plasmodium knowlesi strain H]|eukprot:XP_002258424.1 hypothetical protein, conserved in Plasmodium species [Plasmodium knowlesi strain H]
MNSFFCEDTREEEQLLQKIIKVKEDTLPQVILEIVSNKCLSKRRPKGEEAKIKLESHFSGHSPLRNRNLDGWSDQTCLAKKEEQRNVKSANEEILNTQLHANIFTFHLKKNGHVNADTFFIPYKSNNGEDVIREYTYSYGYYDVYSPNIEKTNKVFHANNNRFCDVAPQGGEEGVTCQKKDKIKKEREDTEEDELLPDEFVEWSIQKNDTKEDGKEENPSAEGSLPITNTNQTCTANNMDKFLVHFRGRLFIGCNIIYSHFKCNTFLGTLQSRELNEGEDTSTHAENELHFVKKEIQTYNIIKNATYWKQDEYPDVSDPNIQKFLFLTMVPALCDYSEEGGEQTVDVVF